MKRVLLLTTGGTIASVEKEDGLAPGLTPTELLQAVPEILTFCHVDTRPLVSLDSSNILPEHWQQLANNIRAAYDQYDAFVITHGTDTMAYTAAALSYLIQNSAKPIVITGAQRPIWSAGSDAQKNLLDSFFFCANTETVGGVFVIFGGRAILGTRARKVRTMSYSAFDSINYPVAAYIHHRQITDYLLAPEKSIAKTSVLFYERLNPRVCLLKLTPGMPPDVLSYLGQTNDAIILESFGSGGLPFPFHATAETLAEDGCTLVLSTQVTFEGSDVDAYEVGRRIRQSAGMMQAHDMTVEAALAKLMWILPQTAEKSDIRKLFYTPVARDIYCPTC